MLKKLLKICTLITILLVCSNIEAKASNGIKLGEACLYKASIAMSQGEKNYYLNEALTIYSKEYDKNKLDLQCLIGLGKTYTLLEDRTNAKNVLMQAYNFYPNNPEAHRALADYNYHFQELNTALEFYKLALSSGYLKDYTTNLSTALCYEKLGDLQNAILYYKIALMLYPNSNTAREKLNSLQNNPIKSTSPTVFDEDKTE